MDDGELIGRVEGLLEELETLGDPATRDVALETVQAVLELYGAGLERILDRVGKPQATALATDELVEHLLLLHGLHPMSVEERVREALDGVRPYLGSHGGDVELVGVADGVALVRMQGSCEGCPASSMTLKLAIEDAVLKAAPDVERVEAEADAPAPAGSPLLQIEVVQPAEPEGAWAAVGALPQLTGGGLMVKEVAGERILFLRLENGTPYAYRPECPGCGPRWRAGRWRERGSSGRSSRARDAGSITTSCGPGAAWTRRSCTSSPCPCWSIRPAWSASPSRRESSSPVASRLARLAQGAPVREPAPGPAPAAAELCDMCAAPVPPGHRHLVDINDRRLLCACRACALLFDSKAAGGGHLRLLPTRRRRLDDFVLDGAQWDRLRIPVDMAFFFHSSPAERVSTFYPSPAGPTECLLELEAWTELEAANPVLGEMEPDVEALLVCRARDMREHWLVPVDDCYELVGLIRSRWRGFGGGEEVWTEIERFFDDLSTREETRW